MAKTFEQWMQEVDQWLDRKCGMVSADLPDYCYRDAYDDGERPSLVAARAISAARDY